MLRTGPLTCIRGLQLRPCATCVPDFNPFLAASNQLVHAKLIVGFVARAVHCALPDRNVNNFRRLIAEHVHHSITIMKLQLAMSKVGDVLAVHHARHSPALPFVACFAPPVNPSRN